MFSYSSLLKLTESDTTDLQANFPFGDISHEKWRENKRLGAGGGGGGGWMGFPLPLAASCSLACSWRLARLALGMGSLLTGYETTANSYVATSRHYRQPENTD